MTIDYDAMADRCYDLGRQAGIDACIEVIEKHFLVGWTITQNGLAREDEAEEILEAIRALGQ